MFEEGLVWLVSTHSRLKAAGKAEPEPAKPRVVSTHSRLKAAGCRCEQGGERF